MNSKSFGGVLGSPALYFFVTLAIGAIGFFQDGLVRGALYFLAVICGFIAVRIDFRKAKVLRDREEALKGLFISGDDPEVKKKEINEFMAGQMRHPGLAHISTRDISWGDDEPAASALLEKARKRELVIVMPEENALSKKLQDLGAETHYYGSDGEAMNARFTLRYSAAGAAQPSLAIGRAVGNDHVIREIHDASAPEVYMAQDLIKFAQKRALEKA